MKGNVDELVALCRCPEVDNWKIHNHHMSRTATVVKYIQILGDYLSHALNI